VVDRFDVRSRDGAAHRFDWTYHDVGALSTPLPVAPYAGFPSAEGYQHLANERAAATDGDWSATFDANPEDPGEYGSVWPNDPAIAAGFAYSRDQAATGLWSGRMTYDFSAADGYVIYSTEAPAAVAEVPAALRLALYGDGSGNSIAVRLYDGTEERFVFPVGTLDWSGWRTIDATDVAAWTHYLGDEDGVFDPPVLRASVELTHEDAGAAAGALYVDDITVTYPVAGAQLVEDFELLERALRLTMLGRPGTTVVVGEGLGPDLLVPVPFVMARRNESGTSFVSLLEPYGAAPRADSFAALTSDAPAADGVFAFVVVADGFSDRVLFVVDGGPGTRRTFGDAACDGTLCLARRDDGSALLRLGFVAGSVLEDLDRVLVESTVDLPALQADYELAGARLSLHAESAIESELRILGPAVAEVFVDGTPTAFERDGEYVVLNLVPVVEPDGGAGDDGGAADGGDGEPGADAAADAVADVAGDVDAGDRGGGGCSCGVAGRGRGAAVLLLGLAVPPLLRRSLRRRLRGCAA
jgi:hypothetical protein